MGDSFASWIYILVTCMIVVAILGYKIGWSAGYKEACKHIDTETWRILYGANVSSGESRVQREELENALIDVMFYHHDDFKYCPTCNQALTKLGLKPPSS